MFDAGSSLGKLVLEMVGQEAKLVASVKTAHKTVADFVKYSNSVAKDSVAEAEKVTKKATAAAERAQKQIREVSVVTTKAVAAQTTNSYAEMARAAKIFHGDSNKASEESMAKWQKQRDEQAKGWKASSDASYASFNRIAQMSDDARKAVGKDYKAMSQAAVVHYGDAYKASAATMEAHQAQLAESGKNWRTGSMLATDYFAQVSAASKRAAPAIAAPLVATAATTGTLKRSLKDAMYAVQDYAAGVRLEFGRIAKDLFNDRAFAPKNFLKGILSSVGIGSAIALVTAGIDALVDKWNEAAEASAAVEKKNKELEASYRNLHKAILDVQLAKMDTPGKLKAQMTEMATLQRQLARQEGETAQAKAAQSDLGFRRFVPMMYEGITNEEVTSMMKRMKEVEELKKKYNVGFMTSDDTAFNRIEEAKVESLKKEAEIKAEIAKQQGVINELQREWNRITGQAPAADDVAEQVKKRNEDVAASVSLIKKELDAKIKAEQEARTATLENKAAQSELADQLRSTVDPMVSYRKTMGEIAEASKATINPIDEQTAALLRLEAQMKVIDEQSRRIQDSPGARQWQYQSEQWQRLGQSDFLNQSTTNGGQQADQMMQLEMENNDMEEKWREQHALAVSLLGQRHKMVEAMEKEHARRQMAFEQAKKELILSSAMTIGESLVDIAKNLAGEQSGIYKAMFAVSKAFAIADAIIKIQQGIAAAAANPWPMNLGAMASVAAATASIVSNIMSVRMASFEGGGSTPSGPRTGGIDGRGGFAAVLHPDEKVIDLKKDRIGGGGGDVSITIENHTGATVTPTRDADGNIRMIVKQEIAQQAVGIREGGTPLAQAFEQTYKLKRA